MSNSMEFKKFKRKLDDLSSENVNVFIGPNNIDKAHIWLYKKCEKIFGNQGDLDGDNPLNFDYKNGEFVLASFNSFRGIIKSISDVSKKANRYNIFKKGRLWSSDELKYGKNFYSFLNQLSSIFEQNPVNTISQLNYHPTKSKRLVKVVNNESIEGTIYLPSLDHYLKHPTNVVRECARLLRKYLSDEELKKEEGLFTETSHDDIKKIKRLSGLVVEALREDSEIKKSIDSIKDFWGYTATQFDESKQEKVIRAAFVYAYNHFPYNDLPFSLYLFYPKVTTKNEIENLSVLMVARNENNEITKGDKIIFKNLADCIEKVTEAENKIVRSIKKSTDFQLKWQLEFQRRRPAYDSFRHSVENICRSICDSYNIKAEVSSRLKTFPSFYNKIYNRSNEKDKRGNHTKYIEIDNEKHYYYDIISDIKSTDSYFDMVFDHIRDIAGVRIICVYNSDVMKLLQIFKKLGDDEKDIKITHTKKYTNNRIPEKDDGWDNGYNYRGIHITLHPGSERLKLAEYRNYKEMQCEIQIRTILAHGWSDVQHPMQYKSSISLDQIDSKVHKEIEDKLEDLSKQLKERDEEIVELKKRVDTISIPMDKFS